MSSAEIFNEDEIGEVIKFNKKMVYKRNESFGANPDLINKIFNSANECTPQIEPDTRKRILKKASLIMSGIAWSQPFNEGNKRTALAFGIMFLNKNGFDLPLKTQTKMEMHSLLQNISFKFENDPSIYSDMVEFLSKSVVYLDK